MSSVSSRPWAWASASPPSNPSPSGGWLTATPKHRKMPNQMIAICTTSVQITDLLPPYITYAMVLPPISRMVACSLQPRITDSTSDGA